MNNSRGQNIPRNILVAIFVLIAIELVSLLVGAFTHLGYFESFRVVFGAVFVLFLPGFVWSFVFFPSKKKNSYFEEKGIDMLERIALSFALSIAIVPLVVFYLNLVGLKISALSSFIVVLAIVIAGILIGLFRKRKNEWKY